MTAQSTPAQLPADTTGETPGTASEGKAKNESGRSRYHHGDLANALTEAGVALAREGGPDAVVLREAARRVGVSPAAAYRHFAAHDDLLYAVKMQAQQALAHWMLTSLGSSAVYDDPAAEAVRRATAIGLAYVRFALSEPGLFRAAFCRAEPSAPDLLDGADHDDRLEIEHLRQFRSFELLSETLDKLVELGVLSPERRPNAEIPAWSAVHGLAMLLLDGPLRLDSAEAREAVLMQTVDTIVNGIIR
jgi:AcrR family transcriptional regulator